MIHVGRRETAGAQDAHEGQSNGGIPGGPSKNKMEPKTLRRREFTEFNNFDLPVHVPRKLLSRTFYCVADIFQ
jgi:hypothetical protein